MSFKWYILFIRRGFEEKVLREVEELLLLDEFSGFNSKIKEIKVLWCRDSDGGLKNLMPGYIFINCVIDSNVMNFLNSVNGVVGFLNNNKKDPFNVPIHLSNLETNNLFSLVERNKKDYENKKAISEKKIFVDNPVKKDHSLNFSNFKVGEIVLIKSGLFKNSQGSITQINKKFLTISVEFFGRITPVSVDFSNCEKI